MRNLTKLTAFLQAALVLTGISVAQTTPPKGNPQQPSSPPASSTGRTSAPSSDEAPQTAPVFWISSVEVIRSTHGPQMDIVRVRAFVPTEGWESAELVPLTKGAPADGVLDLALVADAPFDSTTPTSYPAIEAVFVVEPGHPFKAVRVHGAANRVTVKAFPGYSEASAPPKDCTTCVGKYFVKKGEAAPASQTESTIVREESLPVNVRIIHESDGLGNLSSDPNRMTILLDEKGRISLAVWD